MGISVSSDPYLFENVLLDGELADEPVNVDVSGLTDSVTTILGLGREMVVHESSIENWLSIN